jgi:uncharacterized protein (DUF3084 family)
MSVSYDYAQADRILQFMGFVSALSNPEELKAQLEAMKTAVEELRNRQGLVGTMEQAQAYHDKLAKEGEAIMDKANARAAEVEAQAVETAAKQAEASRELQERSAKLDSYASTINRQEVAILEKNKALDQRAAHLNLREDQIQKREGVLSAKEQEYNERAARLRALMEG